MVEIDKHDDAGGNENLAYLTLKCREDTSPPPPLVKVESYQCRIIQ